MRVKEQQVKDFFNQMQAFNFGFMQDVVTFMQALKNKDLGLDFAITCIEFAQGKTDKFREQEKKDQKVWIKRAKKCPDCGQILSLRPVHEPEGPANTKGYKSIWYCSRGWELEDPEKWCGYHAYSNLTMNQILKKMRIKQRVR